MKLWLALWLLWKYLYCTGTYLGTGSSFHSRLEENAGAACWQRSCWDAIYENGHLHMRPMCSVTMICRTVVTLSGSMAVMQISVSTYIGSTVTCHVSFLCGCHHCFLLWGAYLRAAVKCETHPVLRERYRNIYFNFSIWSSISNMF